MVADPGTGQSLAPGESEDQTSISRAPKALGWSFVNGLAAKLGTVGIGIALARLLGPAEFGTYAVAFVALMAILSFNELGVSLAIVRWKGDPEHIGPTVASLSLASSTILAAAVYFAAPAFASAMGEPDAAPVVQVLGLTIIISGLVATPAAFMQRQFRQGTRLIIEQASVWTGAISSILLAVGGFGAMSLAIGRVAGAVVSAVLFIALSPVRYRIGLDRSLVIPLLKFGLPLAGASIIVFAMSYADQLVVGKMLGPVALGFYVLAFNLSSWPVNMFSQPLRNVAPPTFARLQHDSQQMRSVFQLVVRLLMIVTLPICFVIAGAAEPIVAFVYGPDWAPAAPVLTFLALLSAAKIFFELTYDYLVVLKATTRILMLQIVSVLVLLPALVVGAAVGGTAGVAAGQLIVSVFLVLPLYLLQLRKFGVPIMPIVLRLRVPVVAATGVGIVAYVLSQAVAVPFFAAAAAGFLALAVVGLLLLRNKSLVHTLRSTVKGQSAAPLGTAV